MSVFSLPLANLVEEDGLNAFDRAARRFRECMQDLDDWGVDKWHSFDHSLSEQYVQGRIAIVYNLHIFQTGVVGSHTPSDGPSAHIPLLASVVFVADTVKKIELQGWDEQLVLVLNVQSVQGPQELIPSIVRLYDIHDEVGDSLGSLKYFSAFDGRYKLVPCFPKRKSAVLIPNLEDAENNLIDGNIESTFQVVQSVPDNQGKVIWNGLSDSDLNSIGPRIRVSLDADGVETRCLNNGHPAFKVVDVLLGPLDF